MGFGKTGNTLLAIAALASGIVVRAADEPVHRLKLQDFFVTPASTGGLLVTARVNGKALLRLVLDSGAQQMVLNAKAAAKAGCRGGESLGLVGAGKSGMRDARRARAESLEIGDLKLQNVDLAVAADRLVNGADGVIPLSLFSAFVIRLDVAAKTLELFERDANAPANIARARITNDLLFVKCTLNDEQEGLFLLDTGASYNAISTQLARQMKSRRGREIAVATGGGSAGGELIDEAMRLRAGERYLRTGPVLAIDLSTASRMQNFEVAGLIGYPALRDSVVSIDYRQGAVSILPRKAD